VYTPANQRVVFLFVTRIKQRCITQYNDYLDGDLLFWEGENGHGSDERIAAASSKGEEINLFYRETHHSPFIYCVFSAIRSGFSFMPVSVLTDAGQCLTTSVTPDGFSLSFLHS